MPTARAAPSTALVAQTLVSYISRALRGSSETAAAAWKTASHPAIACSRAVWSRMSTEALDVPSATFEPAARRFLIADQEPSLVASRKQCQRGVSADETRRAGAADLHLRPIRARLRAISPPPSPCVDLVEGSSSAIVWAHRRAE